MRTLAVVLIAMGLAATGCKKDDKGGAADTPLAESAPPKAAADLWKLAPPDTMAAVVIREGALAKLAAGVQTVRDSYRQVPGAIALMTEFENQLPSDLRDVLLDPARWTELGLDLAKPAAGFFLDGDGVVILPISDRDAFVETFGGASHDSGPARVDTIEDLQCKILDDRYTCATDPALFDALGKGTELIDRVAGRGDAYRGDVEFDATIPDDKIQGFYGAFILDPGAFTARARFRGDTSTWPPVFGGPAVRVKKLAASPPAGFVRLHLDGKALAANADPDPTPFGSQKDLASALTGEILAYGLPGKDARGVIEIGLANAAPVRKAIRFLCPLAGKAAPGVTAKLDGERCVGTVSLRTLASMSGAMMPMPFDEIAFDIEAQDEAVVIGLGAGSGKGRAYLGRAGKDLLTGDWDVALWGFGGMMPELVDPNMMQMMSGRDRLVMISGIWAMLHLNELGIGFDKTDDGFELLLRVGTQWANPDEVVTALEPLLVDAAQGKDVSAALDALIAKHPTSPLGRSYDNAVGGMVPAVAAVGVAAAVAIPAFMKYQRKAKTSEAQVMLHKLYDGARVYYMDAQVAPGSMQAAAPHFPGASTPFTPPLGSCCLQGGKCQPDASLWMDPTWVALQFSLDDPHYYSYQYEVAPDGQSFTVRALGDLDCDGNYATFEMVGIVDPTTGGPPGNAALYRVDPDE